MKLNSFNSLVIRRIENMDPSENIEDVDLALEEMEARNPGNFEEEHTGFIRPLGRGYSFCVPLRPGAYLVALNIAKRMLPQKIVSQKVDEKAAAIKENEGRKPSAREKRSMKESTRAELLPQAFIDHKQVYAIIMPPFLVIATRSESKADLMIDALRSTEAFPGMKAFLPTENVQPAATFTSWVDIGKPKGKDFHFGDHFVAHSRARESEVVKGVWDFANDLTLSEWLRESDRKVTALGLEWFAREGEQVPFAVNENLGLYSIKWPEDILEAAYDHAGDDSDPILVLHASLMILSQEIDRLVHDLLTALSAEFDEQESSASEDGLI